jgi:exodeoxyribonuclease V alpha subunit
VTAGSALPDGLMREPAGAPRLLEQLLDEGLIALLDFHFARSLGELAEATEHVLLGAALASRAVQLGHVCFDVQTLSELRRQPLPDPTDSAPRALAAPLPTVPELLEALRASPLVSDGRAATPLVLDAQGRLYLQRYAVYERELAQALLERARTPPAFAAGPLGSGFARWLESEPGTDRPLAPRTLAACVAVLQRLAVICGGPGTGKTTLVVRLLALLQEQALAETGAPLDVLLLAPTGKAAQRLGSSVARGLDALPLEERVRASIPREASTIHRALGRSRPGQARFRQEGQNLLPADVVVVDEVSMVDLVLLHQLVTRVRPDARLILQGDKDQLASVEAGAILGDICDARRAREWSREFASRVERTLAAAGAAALPDAASWSSETVKPGLTDCLVSLEESHRYSADSGIGRLARAINRGDPDAVLEELAQGGEECRRLDLDRGRDGSAALEELARAGYTPFIEARDPAEKLQKLEAYRILCAHRQGPEGVERLNGDVEHWLARARLIEPREPYYENRPLLITRNDYTLGLFNGDVGVVVRDGRGRLRVCFEGTRGLRFFAPSRLPPHETVFATTVHKSQGSEFDAVSVVLPAEASPLLGRELLYTAVTRARQRVDVFASPSVLRSAVSRAVRRASGLHDALWNN